MIAERQLGSFRDPAGFLFFRGGELYRQVNQVYSKTWDRLQESGLYTSLIESGLLIPAEVSAGTEPASAGSFAVIRPERLPFISYPYEWCFSQLKDAALLTLGVMKRSMDKGFWLRDATAYNVQFRQGRPILIDSLSFGEYAEGEGWPAYGQFCRHFLAPLALMSRVDSRLSGLLRVHLDGIPLDLAARLLPRATLLNPGLLTHIHLHAGASNKTVTGPPRPISKNAIMGMVESLASTVRALPPPREKTTWGEYYDATNYSDPSFGAKRRIVREMLAHIEPRPASIWDLGANTGIFSEDAAEFGERVIAWDGDAQAVEKAYVKWRGEKRAALLPLLQDFSNPSPALGWAHSERDSLAQRGPADAVLALALVHHLAIGNNVPLPEVARWIASLGSWAIVEFVPKRDSQLVRMLAHREDIFPTYDEAGFEAAFDAFFEREGKQAIEGTERTLYLLRRRGAGA